MKPTIIFPAETWAVYLRNLAAALQVDLVPFLRDEMRRMLELIVEFTPPETTTQGATRVRKDIGKLVQPLMADTFREKSVQALIERRDVAAFQAFAQNVPSLRGAQIIRAADLPELHAKNRDSRGRVNGRFRGNYVWGEDVKALREYVARRVGHVGMALAGWVPALSFLGGAVSKPVSVVDVPEHGSFRENMQGDRPGVEAINSTPWAARRDEGQRIIRNAQQSRTQAMMTRLKYVVSGAAHRVGQHKTAA